MVHRRYPGQTYSRYSALARVQDLLTGAVSSGPIEVILNHLTRTTMSNDRKEIIVIGAGMLTTTLGIFQLRPAATVDWGHSMPTALARRWS